MSEEAPRFILDAGLHPLCKALRLLGFDSLYRGNLSPVEAIRRAIEERRIWIRSNPDELNLQYGILYFVVQSDDVGRQLGELDAQYLLRSAMNPFSLCLKCNSPLEEIPRAVAQGRVPDRVFESFERFYSCRLCGRIYWPGGHYLRMKKKMESWGWQNG